MLLFCYRLILREEAELRAVQGASYDEYQKAVPRLWPALRPCVPAGQGPLASKPNPGTGASPPRSWCLPSHLKQICFL
jgi:hypothetical protein